MRGSLYLGITKTVHLPSCHSCNSSVPAFLLHIYHHFLCARSFSRNKCSTSPLFSCTTALPASQFWTCVLHASIVIKFFVITEFADFSVRLYSYIIFRAPDMATNMYITSHFYSFVKLEWYIRDRIIEIIMILRVTLRKLRHCSWTGEIHMATIFWTISIPPHF